MKKMIAIILCLCMLTGTVAFADATGSIRETEYELWAQSPSVTCGLTSNEIMLYKAMNQNALKLIPLSKLGTNYYLAICENKMTNGGYNGKTQTKDYYFYTICATETGFIPLSYQTSSNEYYWEYGFNIADVSGKVDHDYYRENESEIPYYIVNPQGKYTNPNVTEYDEYFFITSSGKLYKITETPKNNIEGYPYIKDKILYRGQNKYTQNSYYSFYYMPDGSTKASNSKPFIFKNGTITYGADFRVPVADMVSANGYDMYTEGFSSNVILPEYYQIPDSDKLFFTMSTTRRQDTTNSQYYYDLNLTIYKSNNGVMSQVRSTTVPTRSTSASLTPQKITDIDANYYISMGMSIPSVTFAHYAVIARDGTVCALELDPEIYNSYCYPCTYNGHYAVIRSCNGSSYIYKQDPSNNLSYYWQVINEIIFDSSGNKTVSEDIDLRIQSSAHEGQNGYFTSYNVFNKSNFSTISTASVQSWWGRKLTNVFPDGRYVTASWLGMGSNLYELWYNIYNPDGTLRATGPTGYSSYFGSSFGLYGLYAWAINDSKFVVTLSQLTNSFLKEYYRVAVVEETDTGEVVSKVEIGEKTITPPNTSDTEVVQDRIDFGAAELPIGYNIKDNVIDSGKLDALLRDQVNSVRLNDIVILAKEGYQSGEQNTGVTLNSYSDYDYSFGSSYVRLYTNGQYFRWYCNNPEDLSPGTYSKVLTIGDKTIYVTFKVVKPPTNEGTTTVVF